MLKQFPGEIKFFISTLANIGQGTNKQLLSEWSPTFSCDTAMFNLSNISLPWDTSKTTFSQVTTQTVFIPTDLEPIHFLNMQLFMPISREVNCLFMLIIAVIGG